MATGARRRRSHSGPAALQAFLGDLGLSEHSDKLHEFGIVSLLDLEDLSDADFVMLGLPKAVASAT